ncbi:MAG TPA: hypothetical protein PL000_07185 [Anaerolineales bacterium]|nr:hypothetical protein [Anaerolineales bacterium]
MSKKPSVEEQFTVDEDKRAKLVAHLLDQLEEEAPPEDNKKRSNFKISVAELFLTMVIHEEVDPQSYIKLIDRIIERVHKHLESLNKT